MYDCVDSIMRHKTLLENVRILINFI
jgi:hypothetical protein